MNKFLKVTAVIILIFGASGCSSITSFTDSSGENETSQAQEATSSIPSLDSTQQARVDGILASVDGPDEALRTVASCVALSYDDINENFFDASARGLAYAQIQDCVEEANSDLMCREAEDNSGPICGPIGKRTGYSVTKIAGAMMGME